MLQVCEMLKLDRVFRIVCDRTIQPKRRDRRKTKENILKEGLSLKTFVSY